MKIGVFALATLATAETVNFYKNGLDKISTDFETMLANSDIEERIVQRYMRKVKNNSRRLQDKHKKLKKGFQIDTTVALFRSQPMGLALYDHQPIRDRAKTINFETRPRK